MESTTGSGAGAPVPNAGAGAFEAAVTWHDDAVVLSVTGALDMVTAPQLTESILTSLTNSPRSVVVDLTGVEFLASAGMTVLVAANEEVADKARFGVVADGSATSRPMRLVGVDEVLTIYPTLEEALKDLATR